TTVRRLAGYLVLEVHRPGHGFALGDEENRSLARAGGLSKIAPLLLALDRLSQSGLCHEALRLSPATRRARPQRGTAPVRPTRSVGQPLADLGRRRALSAVPTGICGHGAPRAATPECR